MRLSYGLGCCSLLALLTAPLAQASDGGQWLQRMVDAAEQQSYQGAFVYERSGSFSTHHIWHQTSAQGISERLLRADGPLQEWVRKDGKITCATSHSVTPAWQPAQRPAVDPLQLERWYGLDVLGTTRVADRTVTVVAMKPRDTFRYAYELYLDDQTGLLLKSLLINDHNVLLERFQFTDVQLETVPAERLQAGADCLPLEEAGPEVVVDVSGWMPGWLPPGFAAGASDVRPFASNETPVMSQVYSDGMARFTIFVEPLGEGKLADDLLAQLGPTVAVSRKLMVNGSAYLATVVGEIPPATAERIAASFPQAASEVTR